MLFCNSISIIFHYSISYLILSHYGTITFFYSPFFLNFPRQFYNVNHPEPPRSLRRRWPLRLGDSVRGLKGSRGFRSPEVLGVQKFQGSRDQGWGFGGLFNVCALLGLGFWDSQSSFRSFRVRAPICLQDSDFCGFPGRNRAPKQPMSKLRRPALLHKGHHCCHDETQLRLAGQGPMSADENLSRSVHTPLSCS